MNASEWEKIGEKNAYLGDLKDPYGRRVVIVITGGIAVFAKCLIEDYYVMKDDLDKLFLDMQFVLAAKLVNGIPRFSKEVEGVFDVEVQEEITKYLNQTI